MRFEIIGALVLAQQVGIKDVVAHVEMQRERVIQQNPVTPTEIECRMTLLGEFCGSDSTNNVKRAGHRPAATNEYFAGQHVITE